MTTNVIKHENVCAHEHADEFLILQGLIQKRVDTISSSGVLDGKFIYSVPTKHLMSTYLNAIKDETVRQEQNCHCCSRFMRTYGGMVYMDEQGVKQSLFWELSNELPEVYRASVEAVLRAIENTDINRFSPLQISFGVKSHGGFNHFYADVNPEIILKSRKVSELPVDIRTNPTHAYGAWRKALGVKFRDSGQAMAAAQRLFENGTLHKNADLNISALKTMQNALTYMSSGAKNKNSILFDLWANAHAIVQGFNSSILGMLVKDLERDDMSVDAACNRFKGATAPLQYQRAQVESTENQLLATQQKINELGYTKSIIFRHATLDDLRNNNMVIWEPSPKQEISVVESPIEEVEDLFAKKLGTINNNSKFDAVMNSDGAVTKVNYREFYTEVLPGTDEIFIKSSYPVYGSGVAICAKYPEAPNPITYTDVNGNPINVNTIFYHGGKSIRYIGNVNEWIKAYGLVTTAQEANMKNEIFKTKRILLVVKHIMELPQTPCLLFPESLISDLRPYGKVIENVTKENTFTLAEGMDSLIGISSGGESDQYITIKVMKNGISRLYKLVDA